MIKQEGSGQEVDALNIGLKIKDLREKRRYTLQDVSAKTGLAVEMLSQIESDEVVPPVATLLKIANALTVGMVYFFQDKAGSEKIAVTRKSERISVDRRPHHQAGEVSYVYEALEAKKINKHMEPFIVEFPRQKANDMIFVSHDGEELVHVLEGKLEFRSIDQVHVLDVGDTIYFESDIEHSFRCAEGEKAKAMVVVWHRDSGGDL